MIKDHRPYWLKQGFQKFEYWYSNYFLAPQFERLGPGHHFMKPWNVSIFGRYIAIGNNVHVVTDSDRKVSFSTWTLNEHQGHITIGDNVLICPGCRFDSASLISIGDNCMFAAGSYITDADWHDIYDRTKSIGTTRPVTIHNNVWIGDGSILCKGVTIGENSVIGAGSVVATDIPANVIAAGNPARVIRPLDENRELVTRAQLFKDPAKLIADLKELDAYILKPNSFTGWLRMRLKPRVGD